MLPIGNRNKKFKTVCWSRASSIDSFL